VTARPLAREEVSELATLGRGISLTFAGSVLGAIFGFLLTLILTRGLHAHGAGIFFISTAVYAVLGTVCTFGADVGCVRMISMYQTLDRSRDLGKTIIAAALPVAVLAAAAAIGVFVFAPDVARVLVHGEGDGAVGSMLRILMPFLPLAVVGSVLLAATRGFGTMVPNFVVAQVGTPALRCLGVVLPVGLGLGSTTVALGWVAPEPAIFVAAALWLVHLLRRSQRSPEQAPARRSRELAGDFWRFASIRGIASLFQVLVRWLDVILVGALASAESAGVYAAVSRLVVMGALVQRSLILAIAPQLSALMTKGDRERTQLLYRTATTWLASASFPVFLVLAAFAPTIVRLFGDDFSSGAVPLAILAVAMLVNMATGPVMTLLVMAGKPSWNVVNSGGSLLINAGLNVLLIPQFGITGAAVAWSASILFQNLLPAVQIFRLFRIHPLSPGLGLAAAAAAVCFAGPALAFELFWSRSGAAMPAVLAASALLYAFILWRYRSAFALGALREAIHARRARALASAV
jgi:O-antigen/teichoic acid export membrane protein